MQAKQWVATLLWCGATLAGGDAAARPESGSGVVRFLYSNGNATTVYLVGDWNGWSPTATPLDPVGEGQWLAEVFLDSGSYEYKLLVDGTWIVDPDNPETSTSGNSLVRVGANGIVLPPESSGQDPQGGTLAVGSDVRWGLRYLGTVTSRRQTSTKRYELERPQHLIDASLEANPTGDLDVWVLMKLNSLGSVSDSTRIDLRFDRAQARWHPGTWDLRLVENHRGFNFDDPAVMLGDVGIYQDAYGYQRRGAFIQQKIAGAPLQFVYTDNSEAAVEPDTLGTQPVWESPVYAARNSRRNADTIAFRFRGGSADAGLGFSVRHDRGMYAGRLTEWARTVDSLGAVANANLYNTTESWTAWGVDLSARWSKARFRAEYLWGSRHARASDVTPVANIRPDSVGAVAVFSPATVSQDAFDLSSSRRVVLQVDGGSQAELPWNPSLAYQYEEHHQSELITGTSFLMRRNSIEAGVSPAWERLQASLHFEQHWMQYPAGADWATQFWFRRHNAWLDEDVAGLERFPLLGENTAAVVRLQVDALLSKRHDVHTQLRLLYAAPGLHRAARSLESVLRFSVRMPGDLSLRTHSRLATYRRFATQDAVVVSTLGPGPHIEAGSLARGDYPDVSHDYKSYLAHFIELVYEISSRSDISLGFGVDPWVLYGVRNEYMDIGWQQFVFDEGAGPQQAFAEPERLGVLLENAEASLQHERRIMLEARLRF